MSSRHNTKETKNVNIKQTVCEWFYDTFDKKTLVTCTGDVYQEIDGKLVAVDKPESQSKLKGDVAK